MHINKRFIERDYMYNLVKQNSNYITDTEIKSILDNHHWCDLTFKFLLKSSGFQITIIDNNSDNEISLDDLNKPAYDFCMKQVAELSRDKAQAHIEKIRELLYA